MPEYEFRCLETGHRITKHIPLTAPAPCRQSVHCPLHEAPAVRVYGAAIQTTTVPGFYAHETLGRKEGPASSGAS